MKSRMETKRTSFKRHHVDGETASAIWVEDVSDFHQVGSVSAYVNNNYGRALLDITLSPEGMRALAEDLVLAAALVEENIERKKNAA